MKKALFGAVVLCFAVRAHALVWGFSAPIIHGGQETPPNNSPATGTASFTLDDQTWVLTGSMTTTNLPHLNQTGGPNVIGAHIHIAPPGVAGPIVFDLLANAVVGSPLIQGNVVVYGYSGVLQDHPTIGTRQQILQRLIDRDGYINVHTVAFPGGEIRGQIECHGAVPEPATLAALGLGCVALLRRRFRG